MFKRNGNTSIVKQDLCNNISDISSLFSARACSSICKRILRQFWTRICVRERESLCMTSTCIFRGQYLRSSLDSWKALHSENICRRERGPSNALPVQDLLTLICLLCHYVELPCWLEEYSWPFTGAEYHSWMDFPVCLHRLIHLVSVALKIFTQKDGTTSSLTISSRISVCLITPR